MTRVPRSITALSAIAVLGSVALAPLAALAETPVDARGSVEVNTRYPLFGGYGNAKTAADMKVESRAHATSTASSSDRMQQRGDDRQEKASNYSRAAVTARIALLKNLSARIERAKLLTDADKAALNAQIQAQLVDLTASTTSSTTVKAHLNAFAIIAPRAAIMAAGDRIIAIADAMSTIGGKLSARIDAAKAAGKDVTASAAAYADFKVKIADAQVQATAAIALVKNLKTSDVGQAALDADKQAILSARAKIKQAAADLKAARADLRTIVEGTKGVRATATTTAQAQ